MTAIAANATREEKEKWLMRPFDWALKASIYMTAWGALFWWEGNIRTDDLALAMVIALSGVTGLLIWGFRRLKSAMRGQ